MSTEMAATLAMPSAATVPAPVVGEVVVVVVVVDGAVEGVADVASGSGKPERSAPAGSFQAWAIVVPVATPESAKAALVAARAHPLHARISGVGLFRRFQISLAPGPQPRDF